MIDPQRLWLLLDIIHKAAAIGPDAQWVVDMARAELVALKAEHEKIVAAPKVSPTTLVNSPITTGPTAHG